MVSHETADGVLRTWGSPREWPAGPPTPSTSVRRTPTRVVCTTEFAEREFVRIGARNVVRAPLGVDLVGQHPGLRDREVRERYARADEALLVMCSRLSVEKRPGTALDALEALLRRGERAVLVVAGDGPLRARLEQRARERRLPVTFLGHVADRALLRALQASADVCMAPGPAENVRAGRPGGDGLRYAGGGQRGVGAAGGGRAAGATAADSGDSFADAIRLGRPEAARREAARARAECFGWDTAVEAFLAAHDAVVESRPCLQEGVG